LYLKRSVAEVDSFILGVLPRDLSILLNKMQLLFLFEDRLDDRIVAMGCTGVVHTVKVGQNVAGVASAKLCRPSPDVLPDFGIKNISY
jgi:hypothetical protein